MRAFDRCPWLKNAIRKVLNVKYVEKISTSLSKRKGLREAIYDRRDGCVEDSENGDRVHSRLQRHDSDEEVEMRSLGGESLQPLAAPEAPKYGSHNDGDITELQYWNKRRWTDSRASSRISQAAAGAEAV